MFQIQPLNYEKFAPYFNMDNDEPVSYTHLDVYKRQGYGRSTILIKSGIRALSFMEL